MKCYINVIKNYAIFSGRARRMEFWMFVLFNFLFTILAEILDRVFHTAFTINAALPGTVLIPGNTVGLNRAYPGFGYIWLLYVLFVFLPGLAVQVRRLHDVNKSGWMILIALIPMVLFVGLAVLNKSGWMILLALIL